MRAWANAIGLFFYAGAVSLGIAAVMPFIAELLRHSPRLGWLAVLAVWTAPVFGAAGLHHTAHRVMDLGDSRRGANGAMSLWAGFVAWATIILVSMTASFVMLVIDPPPAEPDLLVLAVCGLAAWHGAVHSAVWIGLAAAVYSLERAALRAL